MSVSHDTARYIRVPQAYPFKFKLKKPIGADTSGMTIEVFLVASDGTTYSVGSGNGAVEKTNIEISCTPHLVPVEHTYKLQAAANKAAQNPVTVCPNLNTASHVYIHLYNMDIF
jgi:hypothetical protein